MPKISPQDPPDCVAYNMNNRLVAVEVTELVSGDAVRMNEQGHRLYRDWMPPDVVRGIEKCLAEKDRKCYEGGPYAQIVVVIHTDEMTVTSQTSGNVVPAATFTKCRQLTDAFLRFSYDPNFGRCPYVRLMLG